VFHAHAIPIPWLTNGEKPKDLQDPTEFLKEAFNKQ